MPDLHSRHDILSMGLRKDARAFIGNTNDPEPLATTLFTATKKVRKSRQWLKNELEANGRALGSRQIHEDTKNPIKTDQQHISASATRETGKITEVEPARWDTDRAHEAEERRAELMKQQKGSQNPQKTTDKVEAWGQRQVLLLGVVRNPD